MFALEIDNQRVPCIAYLFVGNVGLEYGAYLVAELGGCYFICLETFGKSTVVEFSIWMFLRYAKFMQTFIDKVDVDCDYRSAEVEDYVFDSGHCYNSNFRFLYISCAISFGTPLSSAKLFHFAIVSIV